MRTRRTQTNEPAGCATLLPRSRCCPQPLALLEVGASAGLTLLPDRYSYDYNGRRLTGTDPARARSRLRDARPARSCSPRWCPRSAGGPGST